MFKWNWKLAPISLKHLVIWLLVLIIHYLFSLCWFFGDQTSAPFILPSPFKKLHVYTERPPFSGLCIFRLVVVIRSTNVSVYNDFAVGPEVLACDYFTPGLWLSVGDGSFSENRTVGKWPFFILILLLKSEGLDQKRRNISFGVKTTDTVRVMTNSKDGFTEEKAF